MRTPRIDEGERSTRAVETTWRETPSPGWHVAIPKAVCPPTDGTLDAIGGTQSLQMSGMESRALGCVANVKVSANVSNPQCYDS